ncbi:NrtA/SsuA/CpmA family ABC transporter substrate-binding protein [Streptomyces sp. NPDC032472]|uniref:ABC transporter substrate-binding protein n=1 Tax=Streptomyces sp. NPDC032472 TaxID=3155018 RepID=UPI0033DB40B7
MSRPRAVAVALVAALLTALAAGCAGSGSATGGGAAGGAGRAAPVGIAAGDYLGGAPVHLAQERGLWAAEGLQAKVTSLATGRDALNAVLGGQAQLGVVGDLPAVTAALGGRSIRIVADLSRFSDWRLLTRTDRGVTGFAALKGRKVGVPQGTNVEFALSRMLGSAGLGASDVTVVNLSPGQVPAALARGDVDAGVTFPSFYDAARSALGERYAEVPFTGYTAHTLLVAGPSADEAATTAVLRALVRAQRDMAADPAGARSAILAQAHGSLQAGYVEAFQPRYAYGASLTPELTAQLAEVAGWAKAAQQLPGPADAAALRGHLNPAPLKAVDPAAVTLD